MRIKRAPKYILIATLSLIFLAIIAAAIFALHPESGASPSGARLERIRLSPNYKNGKFQNPRETPTFAGGHTFWGELQKSLVNTYLNRKPSGIIPSIKTDLISLPLDSAVVVWFGHSSCFIQVNGMRILVDPVFGESASPIPGSVKAFEGTTTYSVSDMPDIDYLLISHDHYDHLDYQTVRALRDRTKKVICGLGVGAHFERWGYSKERILEGDWNERVAVDNGLAIHTLPARHKSGRGLKQNKTLWVSFLIQAPGIKIYISGDGGYDTHFKTIGDKYGPIDLAIMEDGQYDSAWRYVHLLPEEVMKAAKDLRAKRLLPVHHSKFVLARHTWDEPLNKITAADTVFHISVATPMIGELVNLGGPSQIFNAWWKEISR